MTDRLGRADLHIHTLASDGTSGIVAILDRVEADTDLDVIAITDHERIDAALAARAIALDRGAPFEVVIGEEITTRGGHLLGLFLEAPVRPLRSLRSTIAEIHDQGGLAIPAHPLVPYPLCAQGFVLRRLLARGRPALPPGRARDVQPDGPRPAAARPGRPLRRGARARGRSATATPTRPRRSARAGRPSRAAAPDDLRAGDRRTDDPLARQLPRHRQPGLDVRAPAPQVRPRRRATRSAAGCCATAPAATTAIRAGGPGRRATSPRRRRRRGARGEDRTGHALRLPVPGGVNEHVRYLYENLRLRGHDVRIISSSHGLQRSSEGDVIRLGKGFSVPMNGSVGTVTVSPRYVGLVDEMLDRERFDVLHFHEPFVPFLSLILLRRSRSVNIATFHAYAGFSLSYEFGAPGHAGPCPSAPRPDRGERGGPPLHRPLLPGRLQGHPERRRRRALPEGRPDRALAGRDAEPPVRRPARAAQGPPRTCSRRTGSCARPAATAGCSSSARGRRNARRGAT